MSECDKLRADGLAGLGKGLHRKGGRDWRDLRSDEVDDDELKHAEPEPVWGGSWCFNEGHARTLLRWHGPKVSVC